MGKEHVHDQKNFGEISSGKLRRVGMSDPIRVDIFVTYDKKHGVCDCGSGEASPGNIFVSHLIRNIEIFPTYHRNFKYVSGQ